MPEQMPRWKLKMLRVDRPIAMANCNNNDVEVRPCLPACLPASTDAAPVDDDSLAAEAPERATAKATCLGGRDPLPDCSRCTSQGGGDSL